MRPALPLQPPIHGSFLPPHLHIAEIVLRIVEKIKTKTRIKKCSLSNPTGLSVSPDPTQTPGGRSLSGLLLRGPAEDASLLPGTCGLQPRRWVMPVLTAAWAAGSACVWRGLRAGGLVSEALEDCG